MKGVGLGAVVRLPQRSRLELRVLCRDYGLPGDSVSSNVLHELWKTDYPQPDFSTQQDPDSPQAQHMYISVSETKKWAQAIQNSIHRDGWLGVYAPTFYSRGKAMYIIESPCKESSARQRSWIRQGAL